MRAVAIALVLAVVLLSFPVLAQNNQVIWTPTNGTIIHPENTSVWVTWNCIYESPIPSVVDTTYFVVGGVKWVIYATGTVNISMDRYTPEDLYQDGGIGFNFTVTPQHPCKISFDIIGVPKGLYVVHKITSIEASNITLQTLKSSELNFTDYVDRPTRYVIQIVKFEGMPTVTPEIPTPAVTTTPTKPCKLPTPGFEAIFAVVGLIATAYLLNRNRSS